MCIKKVINNELCIIDFIEKIKIMNDDDFTNWFIKNYLYFDFNDYECAKEENIIFNQCTNEIINLEYKLMEHFRGDYTNTSTIYDELYNFTIQYKSDFLLKIKNKMISSLHNQYNIYIIDYTNHAYHKTKSQLVVILIETGTYESQINKIKIFKKYKYIKALQKNDNVQLNYGDILSFDIYENQHIGCTINGNDFRSLIVGSIFNYEKIEY